MEKKDKNLNVPNLRFPEFSGEWEYHELQSIAPKISSGKDKPNNEGTVVLYGSTGIMGHTTTESYKSEIVIVARVGANAGQLQLVDIPCGVTDNALVIDAKSWNKYVFYYLQHFNLNKLVFGSGQPLITGGMLKKIKIWAGNNVERNKIVHLLSLIEERIDTQKKIIEKYESLIRGLYHSVFNQPASTLQLKDVVSVVKGQQVNGEELLEYGKYYVMNGGTEPSGYLDVCNTPANTISISEGGNSCGYVQYNTEPFWSGGHCYSLIQKEHSVNYQYLYHFLKYKERDIMALRIGSGLPNVQKKDLEIFEIRVLPTKQQNRVAEILEDMSAKCDLEKKILQGWQCQKSHLLRYLFI